MRITNYKKIVFAVMALGIIGFASYGSYNIASAYASAEEKKVTGYSSVSTTISVNNSVKQDNTFCSLLGCAGCNSCSNSQSQEIMYDSTIEDNTAY
jgi:hypothetical protein